MFFIGMAVASTLDIPSLYFDLSGLFQWPDYTISISADLIRLFLAMLVTLEFLGLVKTIVLQVTDKVGPKMNN